MNFNQIPLIANSFSYYLMFLSSFFSQQEFLKEAWFFCQLKPVTSIVENSKIFYRIEKKSFFLKGIKGMQALVSKIAKLLFLYIKQHTLQEWSLNYFHTNMKAWKQENYWSKSKNKLY